METNKGLEKINIISQALKQLGISPNREGYCFLRDSIIICLNECRYNIKITRDIYTRLSKKYNKKIPAIEKAIRTAIEKGWTNCDFDYADKVFANIVPYNKDRPTNDEFISTVSDYIALENK